MQNAMYGGPLRSGYGDLGALFSMDHIGPNLRRYPAWLLQTHTPIVLLALAATIGFSSIGSSPAAAAQASAEIYKDVYNGWKWWHVYCYRCHGTNAVGTTLATMAVDGSAPPPPPVPSPRTTSRS
jgi:mono/diheme cytochrome c family protein